MCINTYKYVLECIYTHYHGGYVFIWFGNFKMAYYTIHINTQIFNCCKQFLTRLHHPSIHPPTHPGAYAELLHKFAPILCK